MTRTFSAFTNQTTEALLDKLVDRHSSPEAYGAAMTDLGKTLGDILLTQIRDEYSDVYLACTVEDADFLAQGILSRLESKLNNVAFACFWNQRFSPFEIEDLGIAPIIKKYQEPSSKTIQHLIVVKSIISGACVVRTNLTNLIHKLDPEKIWIVAPVVYNQAEEKLKSSFEPEIYSKFNFLYLAKDDQRTAEGEVVPGIGGMIYERLGFLNQKSKNEYVPEIVRNRRTRFVPSTG
jgi:hypothetical protein